MLSIENRDTGEVPDEIRRGFVCFHEKTELIFFFFFFFNGDDHIRIIRITRMLSIMASS